MLSSLQNSHAIANPLFSLGLEQKPSWISVTEEQASRARFVTGNDFLWSQNPFSERRYKEIEYPIRAGYIKNPTAICSSEVFQRVKERDYGVHGFRYTKRFTINPGEDFSGPNFMYDAYQQYRAIDHFIYRQRNVQWVFELDIQSMPAGKIPRPRTEDTGDDGYHIDGNYGKPAEVERFFSGIRNGTCINNYGGAWRFYVSTSCFPTVFPDKEFGPWDIIHFLAEKHRSPILPEKCTRVYLFGVAVPLRDKQLSLA